MALAGNQNAVGNSGGKNVNDRKKAALARNLILDEVIRLFSTDPLTLSERENTRKEELLLRMAPNTLPRLTEVTGEGGEPVRIVFDKTFQELDDPTSQTAGDNQKQSQV